MPSCLLKPRSLLHQSFKLHAQAHVRLKCTPRTLLTLSHAHGPSEPPLLNQTVGSHLADVTSQHGDRTAVVSRHQNTRLTYSSLHAQSTSLAHGLRNLGVRKGNRVAVFLGNGIEYALTTYALFKLGAILVPLNPSFNVTQVVSALNHLEVSHLIISLETNLPRKLPRSNLGLLRELIPGCETRGWRSEKVTSLRGVIVVDNSQGRASAGASVLGGVERFEDVARDLGKGGAAMDGVKLHWDEVVNIQFTSGTTSNPKAACLTHKSILNNGKAIGDRMRLTPEDSVCAPPPLFHCFGSVLGYLACATHGAAIVWPAEAFDPVATLKAVQEERCTALHGVPTMFLQELELLDSGVIPSEGLERLRTGIAAGSSVPLELMKMLHKKLNLTELTICYGMTETSPVSTMTTTDDPLEKRLDSVGRLLPHIQAKIVSPADRSKILPIGKRGELVVAGYNVQKGYWNDPERTAEVMVTDEQGVVWMHTGDEAEMDAEGYVKITGRLKDLIIRGGENIHPLEIENCLLANESVAEVSVVGLKDDRYGEAVAAFVRRHEGSGHQITKDGIRKWVAERLSHHLVPKWVFFTSEYPKTASGKIQKFKLQELGEKLLEMPPPQI